MRRTIELINNGNSGTNYAIRSDFNEETNNLVRGAGFGDTWNSDAEAWLIPENAPGAAELVKRLAQYYGFELA